MVVHTHPLQPNTGNLFRVTIVFKGFKMNQIKPQAKLIAALADTMNESDWASDILTKCAQIETALREIRQIAASRAGGER